MRLRLRLIAAAVGVVALVALSAVAVGCGGDDETSSPAAGAESDETTADDEGSTAATGGQTVTIEMGEFYFEPAEAQAEAGTVTIDAPNVGSGPHELVLAKTDDDPANLPTAPDGSVDEAALDVSGEVEEIEGGVDGTITLDLPAGDYAMFCNLPGHYKSGMYGSLTVK